MTDIKNSRSMRDDMRALAANEKQIAPLAELIKRGTIPASRGVGRYAETTDSSSGEGGIASPLIEGSFEFREYYASGTRSSDGLFYIPAVKKIVMSDANDEEVVLQFAPQGEVVPEP